MTERDCKSPREWKAWFLSAKPEDSPLPDDWENKCSDLQRLCVLRSLRPDRILFSASSYVSNNLGPQFADPPAFDLKVCSHFSEVDLALESALCFRATGCRYRLSGFFSPTPTGSFAAAPYKKCAGRILYEIRKSHCRCLSRNPRLSQPFRLPVLPLYNLEAK